MIQEERMMGAIDYWATDMLDGDLSPQRHSAFRIARWGLIALASGIILFSSNMSGRLGFAALLLLAVILGRYASRRRARVLETEPRLPAHAPAPDQQRTADADLPRREVGH